MVHMTGKEKGKVRSLTHRAELAFADAVTVHDNTIWLEASRLVKQDQQFPEKYFRCNYIRKLRKIFIFSSIPDHCAQFLNNLLTMLLDSNSGSITRWVSIHRANDRSN